MKMITSLLASVAMLAAPAPALAYAGSGRSYAAIAAPAPTIGGRARAAMSGTILAFLTAFTNAGTAIITNRIVAAGGTAPKNIGWGIGTTTAAITQTALVTESAPTTAGGRTVGTESRTTTTNTNDTYTVTGTVTAGSSLAITEAGLFDAVTAGNMLIRGDFAAVNVVSGDSIAFTFNLKFASNAA